MLRSRWPLLGAAGLAIALLVALWPGSADAHAVLERSLPLQNEQLEASPEIVEAWFSEPLERSLTTLRVLDTAGAPVHVGDTTFSDDPVYASVAVPADLGPGIYTLAYENVSTVDGHQWAGTFSFVILEADGSVPEGTAFTPDLGTQGFLPGIGDTTLRWLGLLAATAMVGTAGFYLLVARPAAGFLNDSESRRVEDAAMVIVADVAVMAVPVLIVSVLGQLFLLADRLGGPANVHDILFDTRTGQLWISRVGVAAALGLLFVPALFSDAYRLGSRSWVLVGVALVGGLGLLMTYSLNSHAEAGGGAVWAVGADFVHFAATAAWLGALLHLPLVFWWTRTRLDDPKRVLYLANVLDRFSWLAAISVAVLIGTGIFNGFVQLPTAESLWETTYGRVLIVKLSLIIPLLAVAGINALVLKPALVDAIDALHDEDTTRRPSGDERDRFERRLERVRRALPRTSVLEFLVGTAVLVSVAILAQSTTADGELRQGAGVVEDQFVGIGQSDNLDVELTIEPFGLSVNTYTVRLTPVTGQELGEVLGVRLIASFDDPNAAPSAGRSGSSQELEPTDDPAAWSTDAALLTQPGDWRVETRIRRRGLDDERAILPVSDVGGILARTDQPDTMFDLPFTFVDWNVVAGGAMVTLGVGAFLIWRNRPPSWARPTSSAVGLSSLFAFIAGAVLLFGVHPHEPAEGFPATAESVAMGQQIFEMNCVFCHGRTGEGDGPQAPNLEIPPPRLGDHVPFHGDGTLFVWVTDGIERDGMRNMPSFENVLTVDQRWHVVNYLRATWGTGDFEPVIPEDLAEADEGG